MKKRVSRLVKIDSLWGSSCPKKCKDVSKKAMKKTIIFQAETYEKSMKKWVAAPFSAKIDKVTVLGAQFSSKIDFLVDFGSPGGPKNRPNWMTIIGTTPSWSQLGAILSPRSHFSRFWFPFWVPLGPILGPSGLHFNGKIKRQQGQKRRPNQ